jgi:hypothetical protein
MPSRSQRRIFPTFDYNIGNRPFTKWGGNQ